MFVLYDNEMNQYMYPWRANPYTSNFQQAKQYKRRHAAIEAGALQNVTRSLPPGYSAPNKHYQNRPQVEVREIDSRGNILSTIVPPPSWISV
jgi:hypothetical protein